MTDFPTILYCVPGPFKKPRGGTYATRPAADKEAFDALIAKGWSASYEEAASKLDKKPKAKAVEIDEVSGPSREELEVKAKELGVSFNARTSDITLSDRITSALEV
jgi:hypothetical protein